MTKPKFPSEKLDQYMVRFPDGLRDRIKAAAEASNRSMNAEIIARLESTFRSDDAMPIGIKIGVGHTLTSSERAIRAARVQVLTLTEELSRVEYRIEKTSEEMRDAQAGIDSTEGEDRGMWRAFHAVARGELIALTSHKEQIERQLVALNASLEELLTP